MTKQEKARHEAAHFVMHWAQQNPAVHVDISDNVKKRHPDWEGVTFGDCGNPTPFDFIISLLAGPVADHWEHDNAKLLEICKDEIEACLPCGNAGEEVSDFEASINTMCHCGIDTTNHEKFFGVLRCLLDTVRSVLALCETQWKECSEYLMQHERIGYVDGHWDSGEEADDFFFRWGYTPKKEIQDYIERGREALNKFIDEKRLASFGPM